MRDSSHTIIKLNIILNNIMKRVNHKILEIKTKECLLENGANEFSAESVSKGLVETSLRGVDSHGIRLLPHYVNALKKGRINGNPKLEVINTFPAFLGLDADNGFGHAAGFKSIEIGMDLANKYGIAAISVFNSSHPGAMASFSLKAARNGFCSFSFTHADSLLKSYNGKNSFFGTNPICFAAPRKNEEPFCVDMAPTFIPWNKILESKEKNELLKDNVAVDAEGNPTNIPDEAKALLGIGNYKGFALASMVEVLCSTISGMPFGPHIPSMYGSPIEQNRNLGQFYLLFRNDVNIHSDLFKEALKRMSDEVREQDPNNRNQPVLMPNDPQINFSKEREKKGIPVMQNILDLISIE